TDDCSPEPLEPCRAGETAPMGGPRPLGPRPQGRPPRPSPRRRRGDDRDDELAHFPPRRGPGARALVVVRPGRVRPHRRLGPPPGRPSAPARRTTQALPRLPGPDTVPLEGRP